MVQVEDGGVTFLGSARLISGLLRLARAKVHSALERDGNMGSDE
jgi:hypothetical protein